MKIGIQTWGSNGDIRPLLALAAGLRQAGHEVTLVVSSIDKQRYNGIAGQLNIRYRQIPERIDFDMRDFAARSFKMHPLKWLRALLDEAFFPWEADIYAAAQQLVAENDLLLGHHFLYPLKLAAAQGEKPFYSVTFCHAAIPSPNLPPFSFPDLGKYLNPISWKLLELVFNWALREPLTRLWRSAGVAPANNMLGEHLTSRQLDLVAVDPLFCQGRKDWPAHHKICGFLNLAVDADGWNMPESLDAFLNAGPAPVYMTFGSLQQAVAEWSMTLFIRAVELSGCRAIIQTSSPDYPAGGRQGRIYFIGKHPHQPVFRHCAAVVHHGGAGTAHAATRSGCPSIVVPFMDEQLFWGLRIQQLGLGGKPLAAKSVSAEALAGAIATTLNTPAWRDRVRQAAQEMQDRDGVDTAVQWISEQFQVAAGTHGRGQSADKGFSVNQT
ncbi:glycosyltransferase [Methylomonas sp. SURF-2]|uniref:Glycosyltransferase n=1 Tax=Methylomonas subterranea TaxID=2952225 RepID=A0ABT1TMT6_9GAMM|nr:glycosyltransferase [Methylomonas sp. SURF-2]MCQ8106069.1 glycosyltransferase [Methylomonas sp. SURF-2]